MGWVVNAVSWPPYARERNQLPVRGAWVGPRAGLDATENLAPTVVPSRSESLCLLSSPGRSVVHHNVNVIDTDLAQRVGASCATSRYLRATATCLKL